MKSFVIAVALVALALIATAPAEARTKRGTHVQKKGKGSPARSTKSGKLAKRAMASVRGSTAGPRIARKRVVAVMQGPVPGQSVGVPWAGRLQDAARLPEGDGYVIRRPWRAFGTRITVELVQRAVTEVLTEFPDVHVLAIGDLSAERGGQITDHHSHQSGRDIDVGLFYTTKPAGYPQNFVGATDDNLDAAATFALLEAFAEMSGEDGGVQVMFLDFAVQGMLYHWAQDHGVDEDRLDRLFQFPHGRGSGAGLVHHEPNHANHIHVRFKCPSDDTACH